MREPPCSRELPTLAVAGPHSVAAPLPAGWVPPRVRAAPNSSGREPRIRDDSERPTQPVPKDWGVRKPSAARDGDERTAAPRDWNERTPLAPDHLDAQGSKKSRRESAPRAGSAMSVGLRAGAEAPRLGSDVLGRRAESAHAREAPGASPCAQGARGARAARGGWCAGPRAGSAQPGALLAHRLAP